MIITLINIFRRDGEEEEGSPDPDTLTLPGDLSRFPTSIMRMMVMRMMMVTMMMMMMIIIIITNIILFIKIKKVWSASRAVRKALVVGAYDEFLRKGA